MNLFGVKGAIHRCQLNQPPIQHVRATPIVRLEENGVAEVEGKVLSLWVPGKSLLLDLICWK